MLMGVLVSCFFSSRRRHTRCGRDWSSDVCSSDLFLVYGPGSRTWLRPNAALVLRSVVRRAGDSLRVEMEIRAGRNGQPSVITIAADSRHPDRLVDSLAFGVVPAIWNRENPLDPSLPVRALPRSSAGVLAWLAAERLFVEARWGQADSAYRAAEE